MVPNEHQSSLLKSRDHASGSIGDDRRLNSKETKDPHREYHFLDIVSLVIMKSSLLDGYGNAFRLTDHESSGMAFNR